MILNGAVMNGMKKWKIMYLLLLLLLLAGLVCNASAIAEAQESEAAAAEDPRSRPEIQALDGKRFGVQTGTTFDKDVESWFPNAQIVYYNSLPDLAVALKTGKIDAFPTDELGMKMMGEEAEGLKALEPLMDQYSCGFVFPKTPEGEQRRDQMDEWLTKAQESGALDAMMDKWVNADEQEKTMPDIESLSGENGTLIFTTEGGFPPFDYLRSGKVVGFEVEMAIEFCREYGYGMEIVVMSFDGILPAIQSGKVDFSASGFAITEERKESIYFSVPYYTGGTKIIVKDTGNAGGESFIEGILDSIEKTFVREERWKLFVQGSVTTLLITIFSILFGTLLGFLVFMLCRSRGVIVNTLTAWFTWVLQGMPVVVLLMILYYIIFGNTPVSGMVISIVGFSLVFGISVLGILQNGVAAVDIGQSEAACALGCTPRRAFFQIILPQAFPFMTSPYKGEITGLIKATSVVGYIAVLDLAKMGDLVRSRTYEAFFPLIAVMMIYFVLEGIFGLIVRLIAVRIEPGKKKNGLLLKGVDLHD